MTLYGTRFVSSTTSPIRRPMKRLIEKIVFWGLVTACRFATWPTSRSPSFVNATTDGVTRPPSALGMTTGSPPSMTATTEFVVPRSIPMIFSAIRVTPRSKKLMPRRTAWSRKQGTCLPKVSIWQRGPPQSRVDSFCVFPYKDDNPTILPPAVTIGIIALNVLAWIFLQGAGASQALIGSVCHLGLIPGELLGTLRPGTVVPLGPGVACVTEGPHYATVLTSMFMHGGWLHLIGNMWFLWVFGNNIEDSMGHTRFAVFYLLCGIAAAMTQLVVDSHARIPMVGASGAISGVMGAYIPLYPRGRRQHLI